MSEIYPQLGSMLGLKLKLKILEVWITQFEFSRQALWLEEKLLLLMRQEEQS